MAGPNSTSAAAAAAAGQGQAHAHHHQGQGGGAGSSVRDHHQPAPTATSGTPGAPSTSSSNKLAAYEVLEVIGQGSFGKVCRVRRVADSKVLVWKEINYSHMRPVEKQRIADEVNILKELRNPFIVRFYDHIHERASKRCYIVMEHCAGGDLRRLIKTCRREGRWIEESFIWRVLAQLIVALKDCHRRARPILHRDIKPANVLLDQDRNIKLADFGLAKELESECDLAATNVGTPYYMSPELVNHQAYAEGADMWSVGCLLYEAAALRPPFDASSHASLAHKINAGKVARIPDRYSDELFAVIRAMLHRNPDKRPRLEALEKEVPSLQPHLREARALLLEHELQARYHARMRQVRAREEELQRREEALEAREASLERRQRRLADRERQFLRSLQRSSQTMMMSGTQTTQHSHGGTGMGMGVAMGSTGTGLGLHSSSLMLSAASASGGGPAPVPAPAAASTAAASTSAGAPLVRPHAHRPGASASAASLSLGGSRSSMGGAAAASRAMATRLPVLATPPAAPQKQRPAPSALPAHHHHQQHNTTVLLQRPVSVQPQVQQPSQQQPEAEEDDMSLDEEVMSALPARPPLPMAPHAAAAHGQPSASPNTTGPSDLLDEDEEDEYDDDLEEEYHVEDEEAGMYGQQHHQQHQQQQQHQQHQRHHHQMAQQQPPALARQAVSSSATPTPKRRTSSLGTHSSSGATTVAAGLTPASVGAGVRSGSTSSSRARAPPSTPYKGQALFQSPAPSTPLHQQQQQHPGLKENHSPQPMMLRSPVAAAAAPGSPRAALRPRDANASPQLHQQQPGPFLEAYKRRQQQLLRGAGATTPDAASPPKSTAGAQNYPYCGASKGSLLMTPPPAAAPSSARRVHGGAVGVGSGGLGSPVNTSVLSQATTVSCSSTNSTPTMARYRSCGGAGGVGRLGMV